VRGRGAIRLAGLVAGLALIAASPAGAAAPSPARAEALARQAYVYGFPLLEFERVRATETSVTCPDRAGDAPVNEFSNAAGFPGPRDRTVVAPNVDTLYSIAHLDLGHGPVVLRHPDMGRRYFVFELLDPYTNVVTYVGSRTTGSRAGRFAITWTRHPGARVRGARVIRSKSRRLWVIGRTLARGPADQRRAQRLMRRYRLRVPGRVHRRPRRCDRTPEEATTPTGLAFLDHLGRAMRRNPPPARDRPLLRRLRRIGVGPGLRPARAGLPADLLAAVRRGVVSEAADLPGRSRVQALQEALDSGGWLTLIHGIGRYGTGYERRAQIAVVGLGANTAAEAIYPTALSDAGGGLLSGASRYRMVFRRPPPARAFWSLTMYDGAGFLVPNAIRRYAIGSSHPGLVRRPDGSVVVAIQHDRPAEAGVNWLPAPAGGFRLSLRLYEPRPRALDGRWKPPSLHRLGP
jgi:hypothetical protein